MTRRRFAGDGVNDGGCVDAICRHSLVAVIDVIDSAVFSLASLFSATLRLLFNDCGRIMVDRPRRINAAAVFESSLVIWALAMHEHAIVSSCNLGVNARHRFDTRAADGDGASHRRQSADRLALSGQSRY